MSTGNRIPAISVLRAAIGARDVAAVVQAFARDTEIHSSLTAQLTFTGHHQIAAIISVFFDVFDDPHDTDEVLSAGAGYLVSGESRRTGIEIVDLLRSGRDSKIQDLTVFLPTTTSERRLLGAGLGRRQSRARVVYTCNLTGHLRSGAAQPTASSNPLCDLHHRLTTRTMTAGLRKERKWG